MAKNGDRPALGRMVGTWLAAGFVCAMLVIAVLAMRPAAPFADAAPEALAAPVGETFYAGCGEQAVARPSTIPIWCASADQHLENLAWASWGGDQAIATGLLTDNSCDCANGSTIAYPVSVAFSDRMPVGSVDRYERLSVTFPRGRPAWATRSTMHFLWGDDGFVSDQRRP